MKKVTVAFLIMFIFLVGCNSLVPANNNNVPNKNSEDLNRKNPNFVVGQAPISSYCTLTKEYSKSECISFSNTRWIFDKTRGQAICDEFSNCAPNVDENESKYIDAQLESNYLNLFGGEEDKGLDFMKRRLLSENSNKFDWVNYWNSYCLSFKSEDLCLNSQNNNCILGSENHCIRNICTTYKVEPECTAHDSCSWDSDFNYCGVNKIWMNSQN